jgi:hypothetical protein
MWERQRKKKGFDNESAKTNDYGTIERIKKCKKLELGIFHIPCTNLILKCKWMPK